MFLSYGKADATSSVKTASEFTVPVDSALVVIQASGAEIRYTCDGSTPSATNGIRLLTTKQPRVLLCQDFQLIKFIRGTGTDGVLHAHFCVGREIYAEAFYHIWEDGSRHVWEPGDQAVL